MFGDLHLLEEKWPVLGKTVGWDKTDWPLPSFFRIDVISGKCRRISYSEDTLLQVMEEPCGEYDQKALPRDGFDGAGAVEIALTALLSSRPMA
jgi:hypothetical protein